MEVLRETAKRASRVVGDPMTAKQDGMARIWFSNVNNLAYWLPAHKNNKMSNLKRFLKKAEIDCGLITEHGANLGRIPTSKHLETILRSETNLKIVEASNEHHQGVERHLPGGTAVMAFDQLADFVVDSGADESGLGRYCWLKFSGKDADGTPHTTRIVTAYQPCRKTDKGKRVRGNAVYYQHKRYYKERGRRDCPRQRFRDDLIDDLKKWRRAGERIILGIDANEDIKSGPISRRLRAVDLAMNDAVWKKTKQRGPATYFRGSTQIDAVFTTPDVDCSAARFLKFGAEGVGDHRGIVLDIPYACLVGESVHKIVRPTARRLNTDIPSCSDNYVQILETQLKEQGVHQKILELHLHRDVITDSEFDERQERIERAKVACMKTAERRCRKLRMGDIEFSPTISLLQKRIALWELVCRRRRGGKVRKTTIRRRAQFCGISNPLSRTLPEAEELLRLCREEYEKMKPRAPELRLDFLYSKIEEAEMNKDEKKAKQIRRIIEKEKMRRTWRDIRIATKTKGGGSVEKVEVSTPTGKVVVSGKEAVEDNVMKENSRRFLQTYSDHGSAFLRSPLKEEVGLLAEAPQVQRILNGTYDIPTGTDEYTREFLQEITHLASLHRADPESAEISKEDFQNYWKKAKERTSSSISGLHFGHYKAAATSDFLSELHALSIQTSTIRGRPPKRWSRGLSVMLTKKGGLILVEKLRAILLMEADFNFANKFYFGVKAMRRAERRNILPPDNHGSRRNHTSIAAAMIRRMLFDMARIRHWNFALASVDAQSCYDRIVHATVSLVCQAIGMPPGPVVCMLRAIQQMMFHLRTAYGDSETTYSGTKDQPFQGVCQGNGGGPALWAIQAAVLIRIMYRRRRAARLTAAITKCLLLIVASMFVDDADLPEMARSATETLRLVVHRLQLGVTDWRGTLNVSGGALEPSKCFWIPVAWRWSNGVAKMRTEFEDDIQIRVRGPTGDEALIERVGPSTAKEVLGVFQAADSNMTAQVEALQKKADEWVFNLENGYLHRRSAWQAFRLTVWKSIEYVLPATNFSPREADDILGKLWRRILPKLGVVRTLPHAFRHSSRKYQGLGLPHVRTEELVCQLRYFLLHYDTTSVLGRMLSMQEQDIIVELGLGSHFLSLSYDQVGYLATDCLLKSMWSKFPSASVTVECPKAAIPPLRREHDRYVMEVFIASQMFSEDELLSINRCRRYKQIITIADVATGDGRAVRSWAYTSRAPATYEGSKIIFPLEKPARSDWTRWAMALRTIETTGGGLRQALGPWINEPNLGGNTWYEPSQETLYVRSDQGWDYFLPSHSHRTRRNRTYAQAGSQQNLPVGVLRATAALRLSNGEYEARYEGCAASVPTTPVQTTSLKDATLNIMKSWGQTWMWKTLEMTEDLEWILEELNLGTLLLVADGSYKPKSDPTRGAAGWYLLSTRDPKRKIRSALSSPGDDANAYRSELTGLYAILAFLLAVCKAGKVSSGTITLACDNINALNMSRPDEILVPTRIKHSDVIRAIRRVRSELPVTIKFEHVYGHQDDFCAFDDLALPAQVNTLCDSLAKDYLDFAIKAGRKSPIAFPHESAVVLVDDEKCTGDPGPPIRNAISHRAMRATLVGRKDYVSYQSFDDTDWNALEGATASFPDLYAMWMTKQASRFCGTNQQLQRRRERASALCPHPCCSEQGIIEDGKHIMLCQAPERRYALRESTEELEIWLNKMDTEPGLTRAILLYLRSPAVLPFGDEQYRPEPAFADLSQRQNIIGWHNFTLGRFTLAFRDYMQNYYQARGSEHLVSTWANGLARRLLQIHHDQWLVRNEFVHGLTEDGLKREEAILLEERIVAAFEEGLGALDDEDAILSQHTLREVLGWPASVRRQWLLEVDSARASTRHTSSRHTSSQTLASPITGAATLQQPMVSRGSAQSRPRPSLLGRRPRPHDNYAVLPPRRRQRGGLCPPRNNSTL